MKSGMTSEEIKRRLIETLKKNNLRPPGRG
jgi:hypothetical protein